MDENKTREWILERTTEYFLSSGFSGFTMDKVARNAGISKKTLYRLIPSKNKLIIMVLDRQVELIERKQKEVLENTDMDFPLKLKSFFRIVSEFYSRIGAEPIRDMAGLTPEIWEFLRQRRVKVLEGVIRLLEEGRAGGFVRNDIPLSFLSRFFHSTVDSLLTPRTMLEEDKTPNEMLDMTLSLIYSGIEKPMGEVR